MLRRLPNKVKAKRRVVVYDFACKLHKCCLRRYPYRIRRFQFVIDRHHQTNHKACSQAYNISKYPAMNHVNTQIAEQLNNSLRKLSTVVAYSNFDTYLKIIEIFVTIRNLKTKNRICSIPKPPHPHPVGVFCTHLEPPNCHIWKQMTFCRIF